MSWRERLQPGSFRDVPFLLQDNTCSGGRRQVVHEYPGREQGFVEDNGRRDTRHSLQLYLIGADYDQRREQLQQALESAAGAGTLVHPRKGSLQVVVDEYSYTESTAEQGMARFDVTFIEAQSQVQPQALVDTQANVANAAQQALQSSQAVFAREFTITGLPEFVNHSSLTRLETMVEQLRGVNGQLRAAQQPVSDFFQSIDNLKAELEHLVRQPAVLAARLVAGMESLAGVIDEGGDTVALYVDLSTTPAVATPAFNTPSRLQEQANLQAINRLQSQAAVTLAALASSELAYVSYQQAIAVRDQVLQLIDEQLHSANDEVYIAMRELRACVVKDIQQRGGSLARIEYFTPVVTAPALVLAYRLYADYRREDELLQRNDLEHPAFVPAGEALEVLIEGERGV